MRENGFGGLGLRGLGVQVVRVEGLGFGVESLGYRGRVFKFGVWSGLRLRGLQLLTVNFGGYAA